MTEIEVLPRHLVEEILSRMPIQDLLKARCVCVAWNLYFLSPSFQELYDKVPHTDLFVVCRGHLSSDGKQKVAMYDPQRLSWLYPPNLPAIPFGISTLHASVDGRLMVQAVCAAVTETLFTPDLWVCNPVTESVFHLPPLQMNRKVFWRIPGILLVPLGSQYKVFVAGCVDSPHGEGDAKVLMTVYNSATRSWEEVNTAQFAHRFVDPDEPVCGEVSVVCCGTILYIRCRSYANDCLFTYDLEGEGNAVLCFTAPTGFCFDEELLVHHDGRIFLIGILLTVTEDSNTIRDIFILELQLPQRSWRRVGQVSRAVLDEMSLQEKGCIHCSAYGSLVLLVSCSCILEDEGDMQIFAYDLAKGEWMKMPETFFPRGYGLQFQYGVLLKPSLRASPIM